MKDILILYGYGPNYGNSLRHRLCQYLTAIGIEFRTYCRTEIFSYPKGLFHIRFRPLSDEYSATRGFHGDIIYDGELEKILDELEKKQKEKKDA